MSEAESQQFNVPRAKINEAYSHSIEARRNYKSIYQSTADEEVISIYHQEFNRSTFNYLGTVKYLLKTKNQVQKYWDGLPPKEGEDLDGGYGFIKVERKQPVIKRSEWDSFLDEMPHYAKINPIQEQQNMVLVNVAIPVYGLKNLENMWTERRRVKETKSGMLGNRQHTNTQPNLLPPKVLENACESIDRAIDEIGLMVDVKQDRTKFHAGGDKDEHPEPYGQAKEPE